jgi:hypothetical protein
MNISASTLVSLGSALGTWLARRCLGERSDVVKGEFSDWASEKIPDVIERRNAGRQFETFSDEILKKLRESLETRLDQHPEMDSDGVLHQLSITISGRVTEHFLIAKTLDP